MKLVRRLPWPLLSLFFLAPAIGELLSSSAPPSEYFQPATFLVLVALYGSGAVLVRELRVRWGRDWPTVLLLGAAYGVIEEGLACASFFDPQWMDLGLLGEYGRRAGVNWVWSVKFTIFHAVFSITIPILLVELLFLSRRYDRWLGKRGVWAIAVLFLADVLFCFFGFAYDPPVQHLLLTVVLVTVLVLVARHLPTSSQPGTHAFGERPFWFGLIGFLGTIGLLLNLYTLPALKAPVAVTLVIGVVWPGLIAMLVRRARSARREPSTSGRSSPSSQHRSHCDLQSYALAT